MPRLKKVQITLHNEIGSHYFDVVLFVSAEGMFYANIEKEYLPSIEGVFERKYYEIGNKDKVKVLDPNLDTLLDNLKKAFKVHISPSKKEEAVILYNIKSDVSFVEDAEGNIYPNGRYSNSDDHELKWNHSDKYGNHHASSPSEGGYMLTIGAKAKLKITYTYGDHEVVEYKDYYKDGYHLGYSNPAEKLNSWCSFVLPSHAKEIPYTDEAALFFYNLMYGMANISKMIQDATFDTPNLMKLIESGNNMLPAIQHKKGSNEEDR